MSTRKPLGSDHVGAYELSEAYILERLEAQVFEIEAGGDAIEAAGSRRCDGNILSVDVADLDCAPLAVQGNGRRWLLVCVTESEIRMGRTRQGATYRYAGATR